VGFFTVTSSGSTLTPQGVGLECAMGPSGRSPFVLASLSIFVLLPCALLYALLFWVLYDPARRALLQCRAWRARSPGHVASPATPTQTQTTLTLSRSLSLSSSLPLGFRRRMLTTVGLLSVFFYATITSSAVKLLTCRRVAPEADGSAQGDDAQSRMVANLDFSCDDPATWSLAQGLALPPLVLFSLGLPATLAGLLWVGVEPGSTAWDVWSFATVGYRKATQWWESWVMLRKLALIAVTLLLGSWPAQAQLASAALVVFAGAMMQTLLQPFALDSLNRLETLAQTVAMLTVLLGLYMVALGASAAGSIVVTVAVILLNLAFLVAVAFVMTQQARVTIDRQRSNASKSILTSGPSFSFDNALLSSRLSAT
jgi:hypothetical protein